MIKSDKNSYSSVYGETTSIAKIMKGTLKVYEAFKKLIASGVPPITLQKCKGTNLVDYKIYGDSTQEIDTSNLWDMAYTTGTYYDENGNIVSNSSIAMSNLLPLKYSIYDITCTAYEEAPFSYNFRFNFFDENEKWLSQIIIPVNGVGGKDATVKQEITIPKNAKYINFSVLTKQIDREQKICASTKNTPTPDTPIEIESVGEKTKNFIKTIESGSIADKIGVNTDNVNRVRTDFIYLKKGIYTISSENGIMPSYYLYFYSNSIDTSLLQYIEGTRKNINDTYYVTFEVEQDSYFRTLFLPVSGSSINDLSSNNAYKYNIQLEEGNVATDYEPYGYKIPVKVNGTITNIYLNEPLRKIGEYTDYVDFEKGKVVRKIYNEYIATVFAKSSYAHGISFVFLSEILNKPLVSVGTVEDTVGYAISNKFKKHLNRYYELAFSPNSIQTYITSSGGNRVAYTFNDKSISTVEQAQEKIGEGFNVCYVLDKVIEETIELPNILTNKGTNIIEVDTDILPSNMEVKYYGKTELLLLNETENIILNDILADDTETELDITDTEINQILDEIIGG